MIKKLLLVGCIALGATNGSYAQDKFTPGIRGGLSLANLTNTGADYKSDFYIGLQFPIHLARFYTLQPEINYTRQGAKNANMVLSRDDHRNGNYNELRKTSINLSYIDLNVINKFRFDKLNLHVGPGLAVLTDGGKYTDFNFDLTLNFGVGYKITNQLGVEARWRIGAISVIDNYGYWKYDNYYWEEDDSILNTSFQIGLNYTF